MEFSKEEMEVIVMLRNIMVGGNEEAQQRLLSALQELSGEA